MTDLLSEWNGKKILNWNLIVSARRILEIEMPSTEEEAIWILQKALNLSEEEAMEVLQYTEYLI